MASDVGESGRLESVKELFAHGRVVIDSGVPLGSQANPRNVDLGYFHDDVDIHNNPKVSTLLTQSAHGFKVHELIESAESASYLHY